MAKSLTKQTGKQFPLLKWSWATCGRTLHCYMFQIWLWAHSERETGKCKGRVVFAGRKEGRREWRRKERKNVIGTEGKELHVAFSLISNKGEVSLLPVPFPLPLSYSLVEVSIILKAILLCYPHSHNLTMEYNLPNFLTNPTERSVKTIEFVKGKIRKYIFQEILVREHFHIYNVAHYQKLIT